MNDEAGLEFAKGAGSSMYGVSSMPASASMAASRGVAEVLEPAAAVALMFLATTVAFLLSS